MAAVQTVADLDLRSDVRLTVNHSDRAAEERESERESCLVGLLHYYRQRCAVLHCVGSRISRTRISAVQCSANLTQLSFRLRHNVPSSVPSTGSTAAS